MIYIQAPKNICWIGTINWKMGWLGMWHVLHFLLIWKLLIISSFLIASYSFLILYCLRIYELFEYIFIFLYDLITVGLWRGDTITVAKREYPRWQSSWGQQGAPRGSCRPKMGPMLAPGTLLSGAIIASDKDLSNINKTGSSRCLSMYTNPKNVINVPTSCLPLSYSAYSAIPCGLPYIYGY